MGELADYAKKMSRFLKFEEGEPVVVKYLGFKFVESQRDPDVELARFIFEVDGKEKFYETRSGKLCREFDKIEKGSWVEITRTGESFDTKYEVKVLPSPDGSLTAKEQKELKKKSKKKP